jgi:peptidoglycan/LPS O-acetylase OafA/YrhL
MLARLAAAGGDHGQGSMQRSEHYRLGYRPDLEGLRALAVLLVVGAHARVPGLAGGFVGVDLFFVLSGYLITGLLRQELADHGRLGFAAFYAGRFQRLLPGLLAMLLLSSLAAVLLLPPSQQEAQASAAVSAALWLSNLHFAFGQLDYFGADAAGNLFLHTWSLGVEEQFYLLWPLLLALLWRYAGQRDARLRWAIGSVGALSLLVCLWLTPSQPRWAFYLMPLRAWQFALGALAWLQFGQVPGVGPLSNTTRRRMRWLGVAGLLAMLLAALVYRPSMPYPGWRALLPSLGALGVIVAGARAPGIGVAHWLSARPLIGLGRLSYVWYLWHWPVLLLGAALWPSNGLAQRLALVALALGLAYVSWRWLETPIRARAAWRRRPGRLIGASLLAMALLNLGAIGWFNALYDWAHRPQQQAYLAARADLPTIYAQGCDDWYHSATLRVCAFGPADAPHTAVLLGDSVAAQWFPALATLFQRPGWRLLVLTKSSCPMVDAPLFYERIGRLYSECAQWRAEALHQLAGLKPELLVMGSAATYAFAPAQWRDGSARVLAALSPAAGHVYLLRGTPRIPLDGPSCLAARAWLGGARFSADRCQGPAADAHDAQVDAWLSQASARFGNVSLLDLNALVCPGGRCQAERQGVVVFRDGQHLTASFVRTLAAALGQRLGLPAPGAPTPPG